jgi:D-alanyl-D-alanine carboxypeptidase
MAASKATFRYPVKKPVIPARVQRWGNGKIPRLRLKKAQCGAVVYRPVAKALDDMFFDALDDGVVLKSLGGGYRDYARQEALWYDRMTLDKAEAKKPLVRRVWQGRTWYLKKMAPVAVPGTSNHGWGLSVDFDLSDPKTYAWLDRYAPSYGFFMEAKPTRPDGDKNPYFEPWHWTKVDA